MQRSILGYVGLSIIVIEIAIIIAGFWNNVEGDGIISRHTITSTLLGYERTSRCSRSYPGDNWSCNWAEANQFDLVQYKSDCRAEALRDYYAYQAGVRRCPATDARYQPAVDADKSSRSWSRFMATWVNEFVELCFGFCLIVLAEWGRLPEPRKKEKGIEATV